jgi:hypothetical protein
MTASREARANSFFRFGDTNSLGDLSLPESFRSETVACLPPYEGTFQRDLASVAKAQLYLRMLSAFSLLLRDLSDTQKRCHHPHVNSDSLGHIPRLSTMYSPT